MNDVAKLRSRWNAQMAESINQLLAKGKLVESPFGVVEGRVDLRGIEIREFIKARTIESCDFMGARREWAGQFDMSTLINCVFREAIFDTNLGSRFEGCDFGGAKMKGVVLRGIFIGCSFRRTDLSSALANGVLFERCIFDLSNLKKAQLISCRFVDCSFDGARFGSGSLSSSSFVGNYPADDQLGSTLMEKCSIKKST